MSIDCVENRKIQAALKQQQQNINHSAIANESKKSSAGGKGKFGKPKIVR